MAFTEKIKYEIRKKALQRCCICHNVGVEIHHIIPQAESGPDSIENGAPLCPSCHETYGANKTKRKFITEARDIWYEICEKRYSYSEKRLDNIESTLSDIKSILSKNFNFNETIPSEKKYLTFGEIIAFYHNQTDANETGVKVCYELIFSTFGDKNNKEDMLFNEFRDAFVEMFGILLAEKVVGYSVKSSKIDWNKGFTEPELNSIFDACYINMLLLFMQLDIDSEKEKLGAKLSDDNNDLLYFIIN